QLPIVGISDEGEARFARKRDHGLVGAQGIAEQPAGAERGGAGFEILQERRTDAMSLPAVVDRKAEFKTLRLRMEGIARLADDGLEAVGLHRRDHRETVILADMD